MSVPVAWGELGPGLRPDRLTVKSVPRRLRALGADPWAAYHRTAQRLEAAALLAVALRARGETDLLRGARSTQPVPRAPLSRPRHARVTSG